MRLKRGGFTPKILGRPLRDLDEVPVPSRLLVALRRGAVSYEPNVRPGQHVAFGEPIATASVPGGTLSLPAPATGIVELPDGEAGPNIEISNLVSSEDAVGFAPVVPERVSRREIEDILARGGAWPFLWSSRTRGLPVLGESDGPAAIIVNFVLTEPFRARGRVIVTQSWNRIVAGIRFLQRLTSDYGWIHVVLTSPQDPVAKMIYSDLSGYALVRVHSVPLTYPIENPRILVEALRREEPNLGSADDVWVVDAQGVDGIGACLSEGVPVHERVVVTGGPGRPDPRHHLVRIGTPLSDFGAAPDDVQVLRGGLLNGTPVDPLTASVGFDDDAFFYLSRVSKRELLSLVRPGFTRTSYNRSFASRLTGAYDSNITASLRGERRACVSCGLCENICPVGVMPQIIHRYLHRGMTEEAEKVGLDRCVDCNLCTYVCPSKIDLGRQFLHAKAEIRQEREEMRAVEARTRASEATEETAP